MIPAVTGAVVARSEWTRHDFTFDARVRHEKFLDNDEQDRTEYFLRPRVKFELDGRDTATISAEHSRQAVGRDDPEEDDDEEPTQSTRFSIGADDIHRINRVFFGIDGGAHREDYLTRGA